VLGRLAGEEVPALLVCVADSTNLRLALRLALELKRVGRPMILALNMFDIARHRGLTIDLGRLSLELGIPVVASVAVRRGGTRNLLARIEGADENRDELGRTLAIHWSLATALALLAWYVFAPQCASTLGVARRETNSWKWTAFLFGYMLALAYIAAFVTYHAALAFGAG